jgi:hypothetical protein
LTARGADTGGSFPVNAVRLPIAGQADGVAVTFVNEFNNGADPDIFVQTANSTLGLLNLIAVNTTTVPDVNPAIASPRLTLAPFECTDGASPR